MSSGASSAYLHCSSILRLPYNYLSCPTIHAVALLSTCTSFQKVPPCKGLWLSSTMPVWGNPSAECCAFRGPLYCSSPSTQYWSQGQSLTSALHGHHAFLLAPPAWHHHQVHIPPTFSHLPGARAQEWSSVAIFEWIWACTKKHSRDREPESSPGHKCFCYRA